MDPMMAAMPVMTFDLGPEVAPLKMYYLENSAMLTSGRFYFVYWSPSGIPWGYEFNKVNMDSVLVKWMEMVSFTPDLKPEIVYVDLKGKVYKMWFNAAANVDKYPRWKEGMEELFDGVPFTSMYNEHMFSTMERYHVQQPFYFYDEENDIVLVYDVNNLY